MKPTLQNVIARFGDSYIAEHENLPLDIKKTIYQIETCRTPRAGSHKIVCPACGFQKITYNSCGNRNCPVCQNLATLRWLHKQLEKLPIAPYFHLVFTIPQELNPFFISEKRTDLLNLLFSASASTVSELCNDPKYLGAHTGMISTLHTWGQNLSLHPHIHMLVCGGGITKNNEWIRVEDPDFFIPVRILSALFRGKFLDGFSKMIPTVEKSLLTDLYEKNWVVHCKPYNSEETSEAIEMISNVIKDMDRHTYTMDVSNIHIHEKLAAAIPLAYFAKSIFHPCISDSRITAIDGDKVSFTWLDYSDHNKRKETTLDADEFMRRFIMHIAPKNFRKTRYYGIFSPRASTKILPLCKKLTNTPQRKPLSTDDLLKISIGPNFDICPQCGAKTILCSDHYSNEIRHWVRDRLEYDRRRMQRAQTSRSFLPIGPIDRSISSA